MDESAKKPRANRATIRGKSQLFSTLSKTNELVPNVIHPIEPAVETGWLLRTAFAQEHPLQDATAEYLAAREGVRRGHIAIPATAKHTTRFVLVPGMNNDVHRVGEPGGYLTENVAALNERGFEAQWIHASPRSPVAADDEQMKAHFDSALRAGKRLVLFGHSLGGVRIAHFLQNHPKYKSHVDFVVYCRSPIAGSDIAQAVENNPFWRDSYEERFGESGGDGKLIWELSYQGRQQAIYEHGLPTEVPTVSVVGKANSEDYWARASNPSEWPDFFGSTGDGIAQGLAWQLMNGLSGDGRLLVQDGKMPGSHVAEIPDMTHMDGVVGPSGGTGFDPHSHIFSVLALGYQMLRGHPKTPAFKPGSFERQQIP